MYYSYTIGDVIPQLKTGCDLVQMGYTDGLWELRIGFPSITNEEVRELQFGNFQMAVSCIEESIFFLFKIGDYPWFDAPYEPRLVSPLPEFLLDFGKGTGAPLLLLAVDTNTGILKGMRMLGLGAVLTQRLHSTCSSFSHKGSLDIEDYHARLKRIYEQYASSDEMLKTVSPADVFLLLNKST